MQVDTWSPNADVSLGITSATTGETLLDAALQDANWTGTLPAAQDYYLSITAGGAQTSYAVTIELTPLARRRRHRHHRSTGTRGLFNPVAAYGEPDFEDPMTGSAISDWEDEDGDLPDTLYLRLTLDDARFYVTGKLAGFSTWYFTWRELSDFYLQATMDSGSCSGQDAYGLIVRGPEHMAGVSYGYVVAFTCDGKLWVYRLDGADPFTATDLVSLTPSQYINAGPNQRNLIGIQAIGDQLTIYANGYQIAQVTDDALRLSAASASSSARSGPPSTPTGWSICPTGIWATEPHTARLLLNFLLCQVCTGRGGFIINIKSTTQRHQGIHKGHKDIYKKPLCSLCLLCVLCVKRFTAGY